MREGTYEDACECAITANLKHGRQLTPREYELALKRLQDFHPDWTQKKLAAALARSQKWVSDVFAADSVEKICAATKQDTVYMRWDRGQVNIQQNHHT